MMGSWTTVGALLLGATVITQAMDPLKGSSVLYRGNGILRPTHKRDVNKICSNIDYPPTFGNVAAFNLSSSVFSASSIAFQPESTYVQQTLDFASVEPLFRSIADYADSELNITVTNRGEAHITVLTPPEVAVLQPYVNMDIINAIAGPAVQDAQFCVVCLGRDSKVVNGTLKSVFNVVVRSPDLAAVRSEIFDRFVESGGDGSRFSPTNIFAPHITMAFTASNPAFNASDLFVEDGIYKWDNSCHAPINLV